jgi:hypothetical protein
MGNSFTYLCIDANCAWLFFCLYRRWNLNKVWCRKRASPTTFPILGAAIAPCGQLKWKMKNVSWIDYTQCYRGIVLILRWANTLKKPSWMTEANRKRDFLIRSHMRAKNENFNRISQKNWSYNPSINSMENMNQSMCLQHNRKAFQRPKVFTLHSRT